MLLENTLCWKVVLLSNNSVGGGQRWFCGMDNTQSHYHSDRDLENNERGMMTITSPVTEKPVLTSILSTRYPDVKMLLARHILGLDLCKFCGEARESSFVTTNSRKMDICQFTESVNMERLRKSLEGNK
jgi:hypothetical protein